MRGNTLLDKMALIDPAYVEAADVKTAKAKNGGSAWLKWTAAAAVLTLAVFAGSMLLRPNPPALTMPEGTLPGGITRKYRDITITKNESAIVWPWEYRTISEQYTTLVLNGEEFHSGRPVDASCIGSMIGHYDVKGFDIYTDQEHQMTAEVYRINGVSERGLVAVKLDGDFYVFHRGSYAPPMNLGELLDDYTLEQTLPLEQFTAYDGYEENGSFRLTDDSYIWEVLHSCRNAAFVENDSRSQDGRSLSFTATSDALGVYKSVFRITEDGYIWTNIFDYAYVFRIGEEAAEQIFTYAAENSTASAPEAYAFSLTGILTEITDEYILVDDSVLCVDERDGIPFKIYLDDIRIRRHIEFEGITVGDLVVVSFTGSIQEGNVVEGAYSLSRGYLSGDGVSVPE